MRDEEKRELKKKERGYCCGFEKKVVGKRLRLKG